MPFPRQYFKILYYTMFVTLMQKFFSWSQWDEWGDSMLGLFYCFNSLCVFLYIVHFLQHMCSFFLSFFYLIARGLKIFMTLWQTGNFDQKYCFFHLKKRPFVTTLHLHLPTCIKCKENLTCFVNLYWWKISIVLKILSFTAMKDQ